MFRIYLATTNPVKIKSAKHRFETFSFDIQPVDLELDERQTNDSEIIASQKVDDAYRQLQQPVMVIDATLYIEALNGFPGACTEYIFETIGVEGILQIMRKHKKRQAQLVRVLAFQDGTMQQAKIFTDVVKGKITTKARGNNYFYDWSDAIRIFIPDGWDKTPGEMSDDEQLEFRRQNRAYDADFANWHRPYFEAIHGKRSATLLTI